MKHLAATATGHVDAPIETCYALVADVGSYPEWFPEEVRAAEVLQRDPDSGEPREVRTTLRFAQGPFERDFRLHMAVTLRRPESVELSRLPKEAGDAELMTVAWRLVAGLTTQLTLDLRASLDLPRLMPVGGVAQGLADRFLQAAVRQLS